MSAEKSKGKRRSWRDAAIAFAERELEGSGLRKVCRAICSRIDQVQAELKTKRSGRKNSKNKIADKVGKIPPTGCPPSVIDPECVQARLLGAAITFVAGKVNHLFLHLYEPYLDEKEIAYYYQTTSSEMKNLGNRIMKDYNIQFFDPAFSIQPDRSEVINGLSQEPDVTEEKYFENLTILYVFCEKEIWLKANSYARNVDSRQVYKNTLIAYESSCIMLAKEVRRNSVELNFNAIWKLVPEVAIYFFKDKLSEMQILFLSRNLFLTFITSHQHTVSPSKIDALRLDPAFVFMELWSLSFMTIGCYGMNDHIGALKTFVTHHVEFLTHARKTEEAIRKELIFRESD